MVERECAAQFTVDIFMILWKYEYMKNGDQETGMPRIDISDHDFRRLQSYAEPFVDTPATALSKVLDLLESENASPQNVADSTASTKQAERYSATSLPPLTHTKILSGRLGSVEPEKSTWDAMVCLALKSLQEKYDDIRMVRMKSGANIVAGSKLDEGYKFLSDCGFSYQGVSAEDAVKILLRSARDLGVEMVIEFVWRDKPEAYKPGQFGRIEL